MVITQREDLSLAKRFVIATGVLILAYISADLAERFDEDDPSVVYGGKWTEAEEDAYINKDAAEA